MARFETGNLLPCPFCGSSDLYTLVSDGKYPGESYGDAAMYLSEIQCQRTGSDCVGRMRGWGYTQTEAVEDVTRKWNRRAVKRGKWEPLTETQESNRDAFAMYRCSVCGKNTLQHRMGDRYCPQCGAEMEQSPGFMCHPFYSGDA